MRKVLSVASECAPLVKTGGLADVAGALPAALAEHGWRMHTLLPGYPAVVERKPEGGRWRVERRAFELFGGKARVLAGRLDGLDLFVLSAPHLFERPGGPYLDASGRDHPDNAVRFAALSQVAAVLARTWGAAVLHAHDWQAGLAPLYLRESGAKGIGSVMTIHNVAFQGMAPAAERERLGLPEAGMNREGYEFWNQISALKAGMVWADRVTTVSPTYARELRRPEYGFGLDGVVRARGEDFSGILNGIDTDSWPGIAIEEKPAAKAALLEELGLPEGDGPLAVVVTRMTHQKGLDLLLDALPAFTDRGGRVALLGSGDPSLENGWRARGAEHPHVSVTIGYDEGLARRMIAAGDLILVPSRFEPCGLTQLYGLRYATLPLVALTGGLADTVVPTSPAAMQAGASTGFQFHPVEADPLAQSLLEALDVWAQPALWRRMQENAQRQDVGWNRSAALYAALYDAIA